VPRPRPQPQRRRKTVRPLTSSSSNTTPMRSRKRASRGQRNVGPAAKRHRTQPRTFGAASATDPPVPTNSPRPCTDSRSLKFSGLVDGGTLVLTHTDATGAKIGFEWGNGIRMGGRLTPPLPRYSTRSMPAGTRAPHAQSR